MALPVATVLAALACWCFGLADALTATTRTASAAVALAQPRPAPSAGKQEVYTENVMCVKRHCLNPIFPGLQGLAAMERTELKCQPLADVAAQLQFCQAAVDYDVALPSSNNGTVAEAVREQEVQAVEAYRLHLAAMNVDAWEHRRPELSNNDCVRSVWRLACGTFFPRAAAGCKAGEKTQLLKPCRNVCDNFLNACNVECCDESVQCVFSHPLPVASNGSAAALVAAGHGADLDRENEPLATTGYSAELGPSAVCTGAARRGAAPATLLGPLLATVAALAAFAQGPSPATRRPASAASSPSRSSSILRRAAAAPLVLALAVSLQGCTSFGHAAPAWETKASYLTTFKFAPLVPEAKQAGVWQPPPSAAALNSCEIDGVPTEQRCSGRGVCKPWPAPVGAVKGLPALAFCDCDRDWADPECRTKRKSQSKAFFLSLFTGFVGGDRFYMGQYHLGIGKLITVGGCGLWWVFDIVYIGAAPVYASDYRLAADLPHWVFVSTAAALFSLAGVLVLNVYGAQVQRRRQVAKLLKLAEEDFFKNKSGLAEAGRAGVYGSLAP